MSNGVAVASQANGAYVPWNPGGPANQPLPGQQQGPYAGAYPGSDRITAPTEDAVAPPLLPNLAPNDARADKIIGSQVPGMAMVAYATLIIAVASALGIPALMQIKETRAKMKRDLHIEHYEHLLHEAECSAAEPTIEWVRNLEKHNIDRLVISRIARHFTQVWDAFKHADNNLKAAVAKNDDPALIAKLARTREAALARVDDIQIQTKTTEPSADFKAALKRAGAANVGKYKHIELSDHPTPRVGGVGLGSQASLEVNYLYHSMLQKLQKVDKLDRDAARLLQLQTTMNVKNSLGLPETEAEQIKHLESRSGGRTDEFNEKLAHLHNHATTNFLQLRGGVR